MVRTMENGDECNVHNFDRQLVLVEYPGVVENEDRAIRTLGGLQNISTTYSLKNRRLELRFRPDDAFSKPACGDRHKTLSLLLKVKVRRQKKKNGQLLGESSAEDSDSSSSTFSAGSSLRTTCSIAVVGRIETAYRFRNLCDFQYVTMNPQFGSHGPAVCEYSNLVPIGLPKASWLTGEAPYFLPPAAFSRMDTMQQYLYRKEPGDDTTSPPNIIGRTRRRRSGHAIFVTFDIAEIPKKPRTIAMKLLRLKFLDGIHLETVRKFFEERPIWSKNALMYLTKYTRGQLKYLLPAVGYYFVTGPWRVMWIRFGYDPRLDAAALKYQTLDFRLRTAGGLKMKVKPKRSYCNYLLPYKSSPSSRPKTAVITMENLQPEKIAEKQTEDIANNDNIYVFHPGMVPPSRQMFYQVCYDVTLA
ncbi:general transcription factor 3C polypeptide 5 isoform X1 [Cryptotermes secundus]|uniref:general transcription factor 3C polypeptide 5 isoform X1 n=2 Tax=Cryptotermes secundus TaxID=105785 RepID=UPI001454E005|nr:general transcription factor 3C polypeptide 5 isoform X1 [Cryptotermes secundus]